MRYLVTLFLGALLVIVGGLSLDYLSLDFSAPEDGQLTASGALAYYDCYYEGDCELETNDVPVETTFWDPSYDPYYEDALQESWWYVSSEDQDVFPYSAYEWYTEEEPFYIADGTEEYFYVAEDV